ncbi:UBX domain-containing protein 8 [Aplochiton taeniatus]
MAAPKRNLIWGIISVSFFCCLSWKYSIIGVRSALMLAGRGLLLLGVSTCMVSYLYPYLRSVFSAKTPDSSEYHEDEDAKQKRRLAREKLQEDHSKKASSYEECVLRPRQESSQRKKEEQFYRMIGETWKLTEGVQLGEVESLPKHTVTEEERGTPNEEALRRRKLPESATRVHPKPQPLPVKRVIVLPEEPADNAVGVVRVAMRCPSGKTLHRRFLKSDSSSVLLEWLMKAGYHPTIYTLCTSYPRRPLVTGGDITMEEAGILSHMVLNIEEKDLSET